MEALYLLGGFIALAAVFAVIDQLHSRWAWRQSAREVDAMMRQRPPRRSPPSRPPMADMLGHPGTVVCDEHYYDGCPNCGRAGKRPAGVASPDGSPR